MYVSSHHCGSAAALVLIVALAGCAKNDYDTSAAWFSKPLDLFGRRSGYAYSDLSDARHDRPVTANDLVDANGACPAPAAAPTSPASAPPASEAAPNPAQAPAANALTASGVGIGMTECEVVARVGQPSAVNLGQNARGDRTAVLTFRAGRPGVYRFVGGRLAEMDRLDEPPPPPQAAKKPAKKKSAKTDDAT